MRKYEVTIRRSSWAEGRAIPVREQYVVTVIQHWRWGKTDARGNVIDSGPALTFVVEGQTIRMDAQIFEGLKITESPP